MINVRQILQSLSFLDPDFKGMFQVLKAFPANAARITMKCPRGIAGWFWFLLGFVALAGFTLAVGVHFSRFSEGGFFAVISGILNFFLALYHTGNSEWWWPQEKMPPFEVRVITETPAALPRSQA
jgi:hypothetical protein